MYSFPSLEPVHYSMTSSNCRLLTCIQVWQETGKAVWYSHLFHDFPQFVVIHTVKGFRVVNEAVADVFSGILFFYDPMDAGNLTSRSSAFSKSSLYIWNFLVHIMVAITNLKRGGQLERERIKQ